MTSGSPSNMLGAQVLDDREPGRVELVRRRRASAPGDAVRLLDERDADAFGERRVGRGDEIARRHAAAGAVAEHECRACVLGVLRMCAFARPCGVSIASGFIVGA